MNVYSRNYKHSNDNAIDKVIDQLHWSFFDKNALEQVLNRILLYVSSNFIPNKLVAINNKDPPCVTSS